MNTFMKAFAIAAIPLLVAACKDDSADNFIGHWEGKNDRGVPFSYDIEESGGGLQVTRQMRTYDPDLYQASVVDSATLQLNDGDTLIYKADQDAIYARGDDIILTKQP